MYPLSCELQLLVRSRVFCRVLSEIKKYNFETKKPSTQTILVCAIALHGESFCWATVSTKYELLMQISIYVYMYNTYICISYNTGKSALPDTVQI